MSDIDCPKCGTKNPTMNPNFLMDVFQTNIGEQITCLKCGHKFNITHYRDSKTERKLPIIRRIR